jgi:hypothetical protein
MLSARAWTVRWTWGVQGCFVVGAEAEMSTEVAVGKWVKGQYVCDKLRSSAGAAGEEKQENTEMLLVARKAGADLASKQQQT